MVEKLNIRERIGDFLLRKNYVTEDAITESLKYGKEKKRRLGEALLDLGYISSSQLKKALSEYFKIGILAALNKDMVDKETLRAIGGESEALRMMIVPIISGQQEKDLCVAIADPSRLDIMQRITGQFKGMSIVFMLASEEDIIGALQQDNSVAESDVQGKRLRIADMTPEKLLSSVIIYTISQGGTDIHIEKLNREDGLLIRIRINGELERYAAIPSYPMTLYEEICAYSKIKSGLAPDQKLIPQDGGWNFTFGEKHVNIRTATIPTVFKYEKLSFRLLDKAERTDLEEMGYQKDTVFLIDQALTKTQGLILATGPTGSGKTTSLYGAISRINGKKRKIYTVEDPVEYTLPLATQVQVNKAQDLTFARVLRSIMRHDPDVIFVGEIRDNETALIALQLAMTGHLVLASLHTNDAISAPSRLLSLGVPEYMVASSISLVIAQRLVRTNCPHCKVRYEPTFLEKSILKLPSGDYFKSPGCDYCRNTV